MHTSLNPKAIFSIFLLSIGFGVFAQIESNHGNKFEQLGTILPSPNQYRSVDGAPGPDYWQQKADYKINCRLDTKEQRLFGEETITYHNQSPQALKYLWLQLDENEHNANTSKHKMEPSTMRDKMSERQLQFLEPWRELEKYGHNIESVTDANGKDLSYTINMTMMRVDLPKPLQPGEEVSFNVNWNYYLIDRMNTPSWGRGGYEYFEKDDNYLYTIVQWFPRLCLYNDAEGWQNNQFTGRGEFALTFGDYEVNITVPKDHMVGSTGECQNYEKVLSSTQFQRWKKAEQSSTPVEMVTLVEAKAMEQAPKSSETQTWTYKAKNVRDFAWTASRKFVWDAMKYVPEVGDPVMCMSYYPKESYPIYNKYSTKTIAHTLKVYSRYSIPYPYPVSISVEAANGMEYPMITFNPGRAEEDGTYTERSKKSAITVIIHEVGHNYFPMIINSDERQWAWFDEGLNTFVQFLAEQEFDNNYPSGEGPPHMITSYMARDKDQLEPIMTNSENIIDYFANAYRKPATALNILRETIMGRELFDFAFKEYCERWAFKHPTPADFYRTMEDASGMDLDWFWRGWFYGIDAVDISLDSINWYKVDIKKNPKMVERNWPNKKTKPFDHLSKKRNKEEGVEFAVEEDPGLVDFYTKYEPWNTADSVSESTMFLYDETFSKKEKKQLYGDKNYYELFFSNKGGLVMPVILEWEFEDGTKEVERIPVEIWRKNENSFTKVFVKNKEVKAIRLDPFKETADVDESNNNWPVKELPNRFQIYKKHKFKEAPNPMQKANKA
ncbi:MAG: M1 family metallopeptidase [Saprospiraceae bacterium]|nr:M1 family metallopeptidase [Saprospiraceae bacterium]